MAGGRIHAVLAIIALAACVPTPVPPATSIPVPKPATELAYDTQPSALVVYADIQPLAGAPAVGMTCLYETVPRLRVWGDGLVFLDVSQSGKTGPPLWTGHLDPAQIQGMLAFLNGQGFLDGWTPAAADGANPAGTGIGLGVHLKTRSIAHGSGNMDWPIYGELVNRLIPALMPLTLGKDTDPRITSLNIGTRVCSFYTTATPTASPDYDATLAVLETRQPASTWEHPVGICECVNLAVFKMGYDLQNSWRRQIDGSWVRVDAGSTRGDPDQGVVIVTGDLPNSPTRGVYATPIKAGSVRIIAERNNRLTLQATTGATFYFDVPGLQFASSLTEVVPLPTGYPMLSATLLPPPTQATAYP